MKAAKAYLEGAAAPASPTPKDEKDLEAKALEMADVGMGAAAQPSKKSSWGPVSVVVVKGSTNAIPIRVDLSHGLATLRRCKAGALRPGAIAKVSLRLSHDGKQMKLAPVEGLEEGFFRCLQWTLLGPDAEGNLQGIRPMSLMAVKPGDVLTIELDL